MKRLPEIALIFSFAAFGSAQVRVFDASGPYYSYSDGSALTGNESGELMNLGSSNVNLTAFDVNIASVNEGLNTTTNSYADLQLMVTFYTGGQTVYTGQGAEFSGQATSDVFDFGAQTFAFGSTTDAAKLLGLNSIALQTPQAITGSLVGVQFAWVNIVNGVTQRALGVQTALNLYSAPSIGSNAEQDQLTFYQSNARSSSPSILQSSYVYTDWPAQNLAMTLYAQPAPEPVTMALVAGMLGLAAARKKRNS